jgi:uncharacterized protein involved in exopolysaccharide biosynthesis
MSTVTEPAQTTPTNSPLRAAIRHPIVVLVIMALLTGACVAYGLARKPSYTSEARVSVTKVDVITQALPGYAQASESLASAYARAVQSTPVESCVARKTGISEVQAGERLNGSTIPQSPVIRVEATSSSAAESQKLANAGGACLVSFVKRTAATNSTGALISKYKSAQLRLQRLQTKLADAKVTLQNNDTGANRRARDRAAANVAEQQLVVQALGARYQQQTLSTSTDNFVQLLAQASPATGDRNQKVALLAFSGLLVGLLLGTAFAAFLDARR